MATRQPSKVNLTLKVIILIYIALSSLSLLKAKKKKKSIVKDEVFFSPLLSRHPLNTVHNLIIESTGWTMEMKNDVSAVVRN